MNPSLNRWPVFAIAALLVWLVWALQSILMPFLAGALLAYLCNPLVNRLMSSFKVKRPVAVTMVFSSLLISLSISLILLLPPLWRQFIYLESRLPSLLRWVNRQAIPWLEKTFHTDIDRLDMDLISTWLASYWQEAGTAAGNVLTRVAQSSMDILSLAGLLALIPVVMFYLLLDWDKLIQNIRELIPRQHEPVVGRIAAECDEVLAAFIRGQFIVMLLLGIVYAGGLQLIGLKLGIIIGLLAGLGSIIPYFGFIIGILSASVSVLFQFGFDVDHLLLVGLVFMIGQVLEGWVLQPYFIGDKIGLPPVTVIFAIMAGGQLFGLVGMLLALPVAAIIMVLLRHAHDSYRNSHFYQRTDRLDATDSSQDADS
ncbi:putative PurR-regulated permease PerM [Fluviicoccus keumensis]|uniref:Putative PurR-regulated permease PerM n=1 Tax=Fluviicoccus keumensis TaxID=1435465 RepID=A0A4Q7Z4V2_9GAMM|nr:AI-2E family transporter [Fluviicoccus keumensis]RZU45318.1 putative PurR-regulated permease PerM [Fluviicoccus keumensis]